MSDIKISQLPVVANNTFDTIYPQVQGGVTNQLAMSGFNTNDFVNVVNLGTGGTSSVLSMDCSLGDVFVFTFTGSSLQNYTASTSNAVSGKIYYVVAQNASSPSATFSIYDPTDTFNFGSVSSSNKSVIRPFMVINNKFVTLYSASNEEELPFLIY